MLDLQTVEIDEELVLVDHQTALGGALGRDVGGDCNGSFVKHPRVYKHPRVFRRCPTRRPDAYKTVAGVPAGTKRLRSEGYSSFHCWLWVALPRVTLYLTAKLVSRWFHSRRA